MNKDISLQAVAMGLITAFVGWASSFTVVLQGLLGVGATHAQAASGLFAASLAMGLAGILTSLSNRQPISVAWSTPGAALLATSGAVEGGFAGAVGAFVVCALLIIAAGYWERLGRWVAAIPASLANAMLAGVLLGLCLAPVKAVAQLPLQGLAIVVTWAVVARLKRILAVPAAVAVTLAVIVSTGSGSAAPATLWAPPEFVMPVFNLAGLVGIALPLFVVTMASQNIPGFAVLKVYGYSPPAGPLFRLTGFFSLLGTPFGGHAVNLSAITAAMCAGPDAHPDPARRYWAAAACGAGYVAFAFLAPAASAFVAASPPVLVQAVAGLALLGALGGALQGAMQEAGEREAALVAFLVTASGVSFYGVSGAFWGLVAGGAMRALARWRKA
ncbi:MAG: benzoate/H(+) symporter BenE family transporter [Alphaproteobacteria bacterium]|nr:benzoate/H(+) symporter BenE family transporter [Alphaproteobacteria bacterium]